MSDPILDHPAVDVERLVEMASPVFSDRAEAGERLAERLHAARSDDAVVLALPRGGVPVGAPLARRLACPFEACVVRKLPIPSSPEMGFGAVAPDGIVTLNDPVVERFRLSRGDIERVVDETLREVRRRAGEYNGHQDPPDVKGKRVYLIDDGLATGYTALAAADMLRRREPQSIHMAVPVSPVDTLPRIADAFDLLTCLLAQRTPPFAVASFYQDFHDMSDAEVVDILAAFRKAEDEND